MPKKPIDSLPGCAAILTALLVALAATAVPAGALADSESQAPAGQMCPPGSYVIGFDAAANIVCSGICGNGVVDVGEACDDGNRSSGDGCSPACQAEAAAAATGAAAMTEPARASEPAAAPATAPVAAPATAPAAPTAVPELSIKDVEPSSVVWGTRELTITVIGAGFAPGSVVLFNGSTYEPAVDPSGTRLTVTLPTRDLPLGRYAVTVSDGAGQQDTLKRALVVY